MDCKGTKIVSIKTKSSGTYAIEWYLDPMVGRCGTITSIEPNGAFIDVFVDNDQTIPAVRIASGDCVNFTFG